jgi:hypothetical protein
MHPGVATLVSNLVSSRSLEVLPSLEPWAIEYAAGAAKEVYSLRLRDSFEGLTFPVAALAIFLETKGQVQLLGFQVRRKDNKLHVELVPDDTYTYQRDARAFVLAPDPRAVKQLKTDHPVSGSKAFATPALIGHASPSSRNLFVTPALNFHDRIPRPVAPSSEVCDTGLQGPSNSGARKPSSEEIRVDDVEYKRSFTSTMSFHKAAPTHGSPSLHVASEMFALEIARIKLAQVPREPPPSVRTLGFLNWLFIVRSPHSTCGCSVIRPRIR